MAANPRSIDLRWAEIRPILERVLELPPAAREEFLRRACGPDAGLRQHLEELLAAEPREDFLLAPPARDVLEVLDAYAESGDSESRSFDLLERLASHPTPTGRYRAVREIGRGGVGQVLQVWDEELRRKLAKKVLKPRGVEDGGRAVEPREQARFLEEAQIAGQLEHPGSVPIYELGVDEDGLLYYTMPMVRGEDLGSVYEHVHDGTDGWNLTRALGVLLKVCEAMSFAHSKNVIHRDLKPANVMVGRFGEVFVVDWGLARVLGREDLHDLRLQPSMGSTVSVIRTDREQERSDTPDSPLVTMDGAVVGTPCYMSPEQAGGRVEELGPRSDVYALGAMLYELLAGRMPYVVPGARMSAHTVLVAVLQGPPEALQRLAPQAPAELVAICERAMARDPQDRYADMGELAEDLRAYLEHRVVRAYRTGALVELRKWVGRNRLAAAALGGVLLAAIAGLYGMGRERSRGAEAVLRMSDSSRLEDYVADADLLGAPAPERLALIEAWLARADELTGRLEQHRAELAALRSCALPSPGSDGEVRFRSAEDQWRYQTLSQLVIDLEHFAGAEDGAIQRVRDLRDRSERIREETLVARAQEWAEARRSIADQSECPFYGGRQISQQLGLIPLGRDLDSGFWEFWVWGSGEAPVRSEGRLVIEESTAIVLVLLPGGRFTMGSKPTDQLDSPHNESPFAYENEAPPREVELAPFFLSKYEMTQGQWQRLAKTNPSHFRPGDSYQIAADSEVIVHDLTHPVEQVSWQDCRRTLPQLDLELPTEAQWEYAARAGTGSDWPPGDSPLRLLDRGMLNIADESAASLVRDLEPHTIDLRRYEFSDGWVFTSPVDALTPNGFGLHGMAGNVFEWCLDPRGDYELPVREGDGYRLDPEPDLPRALRGGSFNRRLMMTRAAYRGGDWPHMALDFYGVRPARALRP